MVSWPEVGTRVTVRYRRPAGSVPPLTDAVGHLLAIDPVVRVRTKTGAVIECAPSDVVALRVLTDTPVRTAEIRALEHAAAADRPDVESTWLDGWLLRAGHGAALEANSAVPLAISARPNTIPAIVAWYAHRDLTPRLAIPDRLLRPPPGLESEHTEQILVRDVCDVPDVPDGPHGSPERHAGVSPASGRCPQLDDGGHAGVKFGEFARAAVTDAPDGTRWVGLSDVRAADDHRGACRDCEALLAWGARHGATRGYLRVAERDANAIAVAASLGFRLHHRTRYFPVRPGAWDTV
jgi:N-acetylglutamate synthase